ncbi:exo-alpha-sialidase [Candidatus Woesearchaeota archaeon]|nr:exo-alpha-sialidase [Candidatus Woesearchaeota archaeon]
MKKILFTLFLVFILSLLSCTEQDDAQQIEQGQDPCGDGTCDAAEQEDATLCPEDCVALSSEDKADLCTQTSQIFPLNEAEQLAKDGTPITLYVATSDDGITFEEPKVFIEGGGVPSITTGEDGTLVAVFQWFPEVYDPQIYNKVGVRISQDNGTTWSEPQIICLTNFPDDLQAPYDPTLTTTEDGMYRLFFTTHVLGLDVQFYYGSALSEDGIHYTFEEGQRFVYGNESVVGSSVVRVEDKWYMLAPLAKQNGKAMDAVSTDGLTFEASSSNRDEHFAWVGNMVNVEGTISFYGNGYFSSTEDGEDWTALQALPIKTGDPGITYTSSGTYFIIYPEANN